MTNLSTQFQKRRFEQMIGIPTENLYEHVFNEVIISAFNFIRDYQGEFYSAELQKGEDKEIGNFHNRLFLSTMEAIGFSQELIGNNEFILNGEFNFFLEGTEIKKGYKYPFGIKDISLINIIKNYSKSDYKISDELIINCALYNYIQLFQDHLHKEEIPFFIEKNQALKLAKKNNRKHLIEILEGINKYPKGQLMFSGINENYYGWNAQLIEFEEIKKPNLYLV